MYLAACYYFFQRIIGCRFFCIYCVTSQKKGRHKGIGVFFLKGSFSCDILYERSRMRDKRSRGLQVIKLRSENRTKLTGIFILYPSQRNIIKLYKENHIKITKLYLEEDRHKFKQQHFLHKYLFNRFKMVFLNNLPFTRFISVIESRFKYLIIIIIEIAQTKKVIQKTCNSSY